MELKKLMVDSKSVWMDFPGLEGFSVEVANLSRKELTSLRKRCTSQKFDRKTRTLQEDLNEDKFVVEFSKASIKNWKGLTLDHLETLILIESEEDPSNEVPYSEENAEVLVANSTEFDTWLNEVVFDLDNFRGGAKRTSPKKVRENTTE
jgi:predicted HTH transcriptional regulator